MMEVGHFSEAHLRELFSMFRPQLEHCINELGGQHVSENLVLQHNAGPLVLLYTVEPEKADDFMRLQLAHRPQDDSEGNIIGDLHAAWSKKLGGSRANINYRTKFTCNALWNFCTQSPNVGVGASTEKGIEWLRRLIPGAVKAVQTLVNHHHEI